LSPPPLNPFPPSAELAAIVQLVTLMLPEPQRPPPNAWPAWGAPGNSSLPLTELPEIVLLIRVMVPVPDRKMPPPLARPVQYNKRARLSAMVVLITVTG